MNIQKIKTSLGYLSGRDSIYLDNVEHDVSLLKLSFKGEISGSSCSLHQKKKWIKYTLTFDFVNSFKCTPRDNFDENLTISSFDRVISEDVNFSKFFLSTYDHIYEIEAKSFNFEFEDD